MPARLDATARVSVGSIRISGLAGAIDAATSTGDIVVLSRAPSHGDVTVRADVGDVKARVRGYDVPPPRAYGAGAAMTLRGSGGPAISIRAGVGDASLEIGEP